MKMMTIAAVAIGLVAGTVQTAAYAGRNQMDDRAPVAMVADAMLYSQTQRLSQPGLMGASDTIGTTDADFPDIVTALP
jgi:hypothetical protein